MTLMNTMKDRLSSAKENKVQLDHALANSQLQTKIERYQDRVATAKRLLMANMASQYDSQLARFEKHRMLCYHWMPAELSPVVMQ